MKKSLKTGLAVLGLGFLTSCTTVPITGRHQFNTVSDADVNQSAAQSYAQLLSSPQTKIITNTADAERVKRIGTRLANAIEQYLKANGYQNQYNFKWEFNLIDSKEVNAWCMPGGKVAVYSAILPVTQDDAGLATVLGHEIGHAIAHHAAERISQQKFSQGVGGVLGAVAPVSGSLTAINQLYGVGGPLMLLSYSRKQESEADRLGLTFMAMAGFDPHQALDFWKRMAKLNIGKGQSAFLSDHPTDDKRIADIEAHIPEAMNYYKP